MNRLEVDDGWERDVFAVGTSAPPFVFVAFEWCGHACADGPGGCCVCANERRRCPVCDTREKGDA